MFGRTHRRIIDRLDNIDRDILNLSTRNLPLVSLRPEDRERIDKLVFYTKAMSESFKKILDKNAVDQAVAPAKPPIEVIIRDGRAKAKARSARS